MPEIREKRREIVVVGTIKGVIENVRFPSSSKWVFTDKDGKEYKVNPKSLDYFQDVKPGVAVELVWSEADYGKGFQEFLSSAVAVAPATQSSDEHFDDMKREQEDKGKPIKQMTKDDWSEKDRITRKSIERQKSLELAVECAKMTGDADPKTIIGIAKQFEAYLAGNRLVEAVKDLGAEDIPF